MKEDFSRLEKKISYKFKNRQLLQEALTHRSYLNEHPSWSVNHNERLEYLGDAVLELITSEFLFHLFPKATEGELTSLRSALVNHEMLAKVAKKINLEKFIFLSRGEAKDKGKGHEVILANTLEAIIGAIFLDANYQTAKNFVKKFILINLDEVLEKKTYKDPKSLLQEIIQEKMKITPTYRVLRETGPDHQKKFLVGVYFGETLAAQGSGGSKQEAEKKAAEKALKSLNEK